MRYALALSLAACATEYPCEPVGFTDVYWASHEEFSDYWIGQQSCFSLRSDGWAVLVGEDLDYLERVAWSQNGNTVNLHGIPVARYEQTQDGYTVTFVFGDFEPYVATRCDWL